MYSLLTGSHPYEIQSGDSLWMISQRYHTTIQAIEAVNPGIDMNNLYIGHILLIPQSCDIYHISAQQPSGDTISEEDLSNPLRMLWEQHVYWTRLVFLSMIFDLPDTELVTDRLLRNPKDFEAALIPFYGEDIAAEFAELFTEHLKIAGDLVKALKDNDNTAADAAEERWYENADLIATFLGSINPYWTSQEWQSMLYDHLAMTKDEAVSLIAGNYTDSITVFDEIEQEALEMADTMTQGIIRQFPEYF
jgi:LysM repeat protein